MARYERFGSTDLPPAQQAAMRRAVRLEVITLCYMVTCVALVAWVMGSSQAMKAAWIEDMLAFIPPIAFLVASRMIRKPPSPEYPYARHRAVASGHLAAAVALLIVGGFLIVDSVSGLIAVERPPIGTMRLFGQTFWAGWAMIAAMIYTGVGPVILGRLKLPLADKLHDRILYADADMQKADWMTAGGSILGILGIGLGFWWADSVAATLIAVSIVHDGWRNLRFALRGLMDGRARSTDMTRTHPLVGDVQRIVEGHPGLSAARTRVRDVGHLLQVDGFVVPSGGELPTAELERIVEKVRELDWKLDDIVLMPVSRLPDVPDPRTEPGT